MTIKQLMQISEWNQLPQGVQDFIINWKKKKGYPHESPLLTIGQALELYIAVSYSFRKDDMLHGTFNSVIDGEEFMLGWDGEELIDIVMYHNVKHILKRLSTSHHEILVEEDENCYATDTSQSLVYDREGVTI